MMYGETPFKQWEEAIRNLEFDANVESENVKKFELTTEEVRWLGGSVDLGINEIKAYLEKTKRKDLVGWEKDHLKFLKVLNKKLAKEQKRREKNNGE